MKTVLVVDDEFLIRWALNEGLKSSYRVLTVSGVDEALRILDVERVDAVITDLRMPLRDGMELVKNLRGDRPDVKVFVMSAATNDDDLRRCLDLDVETVLRKPLELPVIRGILESHLAGGPGSLTFPRAC